ncbi:MAG: hypothetical protein WDW36_001133 [Sanguina aurantia]
MASDQAAGTDLVLAVCTSASRLPMALGSRAWSRGIPTVFSSDSLSHQLPPSLRSTLLPSEQLVTYPDSPTPTPGTPADRRWAMTPLLAWRALQDAHPSVAPQKPSSVATAATGFQWMLFGDDDTVFLIPGVQNLLQQLDPSHPYFLTDALLCPPTFPDCRHLVCPPCPAQHDVSSSSSSVGSAGSSSSSSDSSGSSSSGNRQTADQHDDLQACAECSPATLCRQHHPTRFKHCMASHRVWFYGGAGAIISVGLFLKLQEAGGWDLYESCVQSEGSERAIGGDAIMADCLWQLGVPITTPEGVHFGKPPRQSYFDGLSWQVLAQMPGLLLADSRGRGHGNQRALQLHVPDLQYAVSMHVSQAFFSQAALPGHTRPPLFQAAGVCALVAGYELALLAMDVLQGVDLQAHGQAMP